MPRLSPTELASCTSSELANHLGKIIDEIARMKREKTDDPDRLSELTSNLESVKKAIHTRLFTNGGPTQALLVRPQGDHVQQQSALLEEIQTHIARLRDNLRTEPLDMTAAIKAHLSYQINLLKYYSAKIPTRTLNDSDLRTFKSFFPEYGDVQFNRQYIHAPNPVMPVLEQQTRIMVDIALAIKKLKTLESLTLEIAIINLHLEQEQITRTDLELLIRDIRELKRYAELPIHEQTALRAELERARGNRYAALQQLGVETPSELSLEELQEQSRTLSSFIAAVRAQNLTEEQRQATQALLPELDIAFHHEYQVPQARVERRLEL